LVILQFLLVKSVMAGGAITQAGEVLGAHLLVTIQTPTHILPLLGYGGFHPGQVAVAGLAIHPGCDVRTMVEMDKIRLNGNRYPRDWLIVFDVAGQFIQLSGRFGDLLVTAPTLAARGQASHWTSRSAGVAVQALGPQPHVKTVRKLDWLRRRNLGQVNAANRRSQHHEQEQTETNAEERAFPKG
jgi:hypothetical protein